MLPRPPTLQGRCFRLSTTNGSATSFVVDSNSVLSPDTTYYIRVGNLYGGATIMRRRCSAPARSRPRSPTPRFIRLFHLDHGELDGAGLGPGIHPAGLHLHGLQPDCRFLPNNECVAEHLDGEGLTPGVVYYLRVGGLNWNNVPNYATRWKLPAARPPGWRTTGGEAWPITNLQTSPTLGTAVTGMTANPCRGIAITPDGNTAWVADNSTAKPGRSPI